MVCLLSIIIYIFKFILFVGLICVFDVKVVCCVVLVLSCVVEGCIRFVGLNVVEDIIGWCCDDGWIVIVVVVVWVVVSGSVVIVVF